MSKDQGSLPCIAPGAAAVAAPFEGLLDVAAPIPPAQTIYHHGFTTAHHGPTALRVWKSLGMTLVEAGGSRWSLEPGNHQNDQFTNFMLISVGKKPGDIWRLELPLEPDGARASCHWAWCRSSSWSPPRRRRTWPLTRQKAGHSGRSDATHWNSRQETK